MITLIVYFVVRAGHYSIYKGMKKDDKEMTKKDFRDITQIILLGCFVIEFAVFSLGFWLAS